MATILTTRVLEAEIGDLLEDDCPLCRQRRLLVLPFRYAFRGRFLYGVRCTHCALVFVHPQPDGEEITQMYGEEYFTAHSDSIGAHGAGAYMEQAKQGVHERGNASRRMDRRLLSVLETRGRFLEIGCGPGFFLSEMRNRGWQVAGVEISSYAVRHAREELGLEVTEAALDDAHLPARSFDAIFLGDVLEHLPSPTASLRRIAGWLRPGGALVVAVPSTMNLLSARLGLSLYRLRRRWKTLRLPPYHLFEYTPATLRRMIDGAGFRVERIEQSAVPLARMGLRGSALENSAKVTMQVPAILSSRLINRGGDRLLAVAKRESIER
ncbi:MAG: class I SAM-dependent methyltransferase [Candidatus Eisenbacteria bacterium]